MDPARINARTVAKIVAITLLVLAAAMLLALVLLNTRTTLRWLLAAVFLTFVLYPAVDVAGRVRIRGHSPPRWLAVLATYAGLAALFLFLTLQVIPPIISEAEGLGPKVPGYVSDFEGWAERNKDFKELNDRFNLTDTLSKEASGLPSHLGDAASSVGSFTVMLLEEVIAAITILTLTFFLLIDGRRLGNVALERFSPHGAERTRRIVGRIYEVIRAYVTVNLVLAGAAGVFTWLALELLGVELAITMAVIVAFLDLIPLIGLTLGGLAVAVVVSFHDFPTALIIWAALFILYQQLQDRVIQPVMYGNAVHVNPAIAIVALLVGAELLGVLGALLAVPAAASIGVVLDELLPQRDKGQEPAGAGGDQEPDGPAPAPG